MRLPLPNLSPDDPLHENEGGGGNQDCPCVAAAMELLKDAADGGKFDPRLLEVELKFAQIFSDIPDGLGLRALWMVIVGNDVDVPGSVRKDYQIDLLEKLALKPEEYKPGGHETCLIRGWLCMVRTKANWEKSKGWVPVPELSGDPDLTPSNDKNTSQTDVQVEEFLDRYARPFFGDRAKPALDLYVTFYHEGLESLLEHADSYAFLVFNKSGPRDVVVRELLKMIVEIRILYWLYADDPDSSETMMLAVRAFVTAFTMFTPSDARPAIPKSGSRSAPVMPRHYAGSVKPDRTRWLPYVVFLMELSEKSSAVVDWFCLAESRDARRNGPLNKAIESVHDKMDEEDWQAWITPAVVACWLGKKYKVLSDL